MLRQNSEDLNVERSMSEVPARLSAAQARAAMAEIEPGYSPQQALVESERCLYCFDAPCIAACPTGIDIPGFIRKIAGGNLAGAARTILQANVLGASCARVCPTAELCEGACVMLDRDQQPIKIGRLQRHAVDHVLERRIEVLSTPKKRSGRKIAVIGAGPAGLGCAAELAQLGHGVTVFEKKALPGGLNTYGIAYYKLRPETSLAEVDLVRRLGVEIRTGVEVGKDISVPRLEKQFDAIFVGVGLGRTYRLNIPGEDLNGVVEALEFIEQLHTRPLHKVPIGRRVAVIGCGNTAIDAVTQARRLGAERAIIVYRRGEADMPAYPYEYELGKADGCGFLFHALPVEVIGEKGRVTGLRLIRTRPNGRGGIETVAGSEFVESFDMVIKALGQEPRSARLKSLFPRLKLDRDGVVVRNFDTGRTSIPHVFAGGDCSNGGREVVNAVAEGKRAARGIHRYLGGRKVEGPIQPSRFGVKGKPLGSGYLRPVRVRELEGERCGKTRS
jgi:glutamate synthase (NADPH/NADH) small chain